MKITELLNAAGVNQLRKLKAPDLKKTYKQISKALKGRTKTFRKHGREEAVPERFRDGLENPAGMSRNEMLAGLSDALAYMRGQVSTFKGWSEVQQKRMDAYNKTMADSEQDTFKSFEEFDRYGRFMGSMQERFGKLWSYASDQTKELYDAAKKNGADLGELTERLNLDPEQLIKNFEFWSEHMDALANAEPITWHRSGRPVYASDYARKLGLGKIRKK